MHHQLKKKKIVKMNIEYAFKKGEKVLVSLNGLTWFNRVFVVEFNGLFFVQHTENSPLAPYEYIKSFVEEPLEFAY
jgi:hypothetical protein